MGRPKNERPAIKRKTKQKKIYRTSCQSLFVRPAGNVLTSSYVKRLFFCWEKIIRKYKC